MYLLIIPRSNRFRSTSLREARQKHYVAYGTIDDLDPLASGRLDCTRSAMDPLFMQFRSTSLREARPSFLSIAKCPQEI